ncbi:MAG: putative Ferredoxin reductase [Nitrospira sp.]|jgi:phenol hydroxylase P5 protein|nr:putative Ferredoxin reductase [Nitrospira sp.]
MAEPTQMAEIVSLSALTAHTTELVLLPLKRSISFEPGQWISLQLPVGERPPLNRAYSLAEPESSTGRLTLVFDHVPGGKGSGYLSKLQAGNCIPLSGPYGRFVLSHQDSQHLLLIGRYSGLVPLRCILLSLASQGTLPLTTLIAQAPSYDEQLYHEEFMTLATNQPNFHYLPLVSADPADSAAAVEAIQQIAGNGRNVTPMIAGIKSFARPLRTVLMELGFDRRAVKLETYD